VHFVTLQIAFSELDKVIYQHFINRFPFEVAVCDLEINVRILT